MDKEKKYFYILTLSVIIELFLVLVILFISSNFLIYSDFSLLKNINESVFINAKHFIYISFILEFILFISAITVIWIITRYKNIFFGKNFEDIAMTDSLTGLYNRRYFDSFYENIFDQASRYGTIFSLIMCDIDHFKKINDTYGHDKGDLVLKEVAKILKNNMRKSDIASRYGGEEFIVVLPQTGLSKSLDVARKIKTLISKISIKDTGKITISIGVISYSKEFEDKSKDFLKKVDELLYEAKNRGRNRIMSVDTNNENIEVSENPWVDD
ncbi:MAG: GGDEF domain-containing protein [Candidatus Acididesulfobacter diazotrophicus]|uniref:GGDEF domain-containing protein n=1 Tax=Candidatus Acididesulfobacter diazotrophicus TaxID=2597226 RepID=A0A519BL38_9DELT|nr:MAG: GGDEF domain-containing protein [Candidatus Acididesulfobacter diazotrophicus]